MFDYFGYGSNMNMTSLRHKGVEPVATTPAVLHGWRLRFNVTHFFAHEGGVGNIEPTGDPGDRVHGLVHRLAVEHLPPLDEAEACGHGYRRIAVEVATANGPVRATAYVGMAAFVDDACLPTQRYLNIVVRGAIEAGLDARYIEWLRARPLKPQDPVPPFAHPPGEHPVFDAATLAARPQCTALDGAVFDMTHARPKHAFLKRWFGGRDTTLFHLRRLDTTDGTETIADVRHGRLTAYQRRYLDQYLHAYAQEYDYAGRFRYDDE